MAGIDIIAKVYSDDEKSNTFRHIQKSIDGVTQGNVYMFTTHPDRGNLILNVGAFLILEAVAGTPVTRPIFSIGTNGNSYDNIRVLTNTLATTVGVVLSPSLTAGYSIIPPNTDVYLKIGTAATGYTQYDFNLCMEGHYDGGL